MALREDYQDYVPNAAGKKYVISDVGAGQSTITDATVYDQVGDTFNAGVINATNAQVNKITPVHFYSTNVLKSAFVSNSTYADYPYRAAVALSGVLESMIPEVYFDVPQITSGIYAPVARAYNGGIYLYASEVPSANFTIPTIICWKGVS